MPPSRHRKRITSKQANVRRLDQELTTRVEERRLKESMSLSGSRPVTLTTAQMGLMGLQPDPCNPEQVLQPLNLTSVRPDTATIHNSLLLLPIENNTSISNIPLTHQALQQDDKVKSQLSQFRPEYQLHPYQSQIPISSAPSLLSLSSSSLAQPPQITSINHNGKCMASELSTALPTSKTLKDFMTEFQGAEEHEVIDDIGQVEGDITLTGYNRSRLYKLRTSVQDSIVSPPSAQDIRQFATETSMRTHQQQRNHNDFVYSLIKKRQNARALKTKFKYTSNQQLFMWFCIKMEKYADGILVTGEKTVDFIRKVLLVFGNRNKGKNFGKPLGSESIKGYVAAIVDLWQSQVDFKRNHEPSPREYKPLQYLLEQLYRELASTQGNQTVRRNQNQFLSVYTAKKFQDMQGTLFQKGGELDLRMHLDLLMGHFMLLRSQNRLGAELGDLFTVSQVNEGPHGEVNMLFLLLREGKTQHFSKLEFSYVFRHREVELCTVGALALYLWFRFDIQREQWPQWQNGFEWQSIKLLKASGSQFAPFKYDTQLKDIKRLFEKHDVHVKSLTHSGRKAGVLYGEALYIPDADLRLLGHWDKSRMTKHYSSGVSRPAAKLMAGHKPEDGSYYISRECLLPPSTLQKFIFPRLEESWQYLQSITIKDRDRAAQAFLETLEWLRIVILQDAVVLSEKYPTSPLWRHRPFNLPEFQSFKRLALQKIEDEVHPEYVQLQRTIPLIADRLKLLNQVILDGLNNVHNLHNENHNTIQDLQQLNQEILNKVLLNETHLTRWNLSMEGFMEADPTNVQLQQQLQGALQIQTASATLTATSPNSQSITIASTSTSTPIMITVSQSNQLDNDDNNNEIPVFEPSPSIESVEQVYEEYYEGLVDSSNGHRSWSLRKIEETYKTAWRQKEYVRKRYQRRLSLIQRLQLTAQRLEITEQEAARKMELWKRQKKWSLDKLQKQIKKDSEQWGLNDQDLIMY